MCQVASRPGLEAEKGFSHRRLVVDPGEANQYALNRYPVGCPLLA
jgi:hypothetical protein